MERNSVPVTEEKVKYYIALQRLGVKRVHGSMLDEAASKTTQHHASEHVDEYYLVHKSLQPDLDKRLGPEVFVTLANPDDFPPHLDISRMWIVDMCVPRAQLGPRVTTWKTTVGIKSETPEGEMLSIEDGAPKQEGAAVSPLPSANQPRALPVSQMPQTDAAPSKPRQILRRRISEEGDEAAMTKMLDSAEKAAYDDFWVASDEARADSFQHNLQIFAEHIENLPKEAPVPKTSTDFLELVQRVMKSKRCYDHLQILCPYLQRANDARPECFTRLGSAILKLGNFKADQAGKPGLSFMPISERHNFERSPLYIQFMEVRTTALKYKVKASCKTAQFTPPEQKQMLAYVQGLLDLKVLSEADRTELLVAKTMLLSLPLKEEIAYLIQDAERVKIFLAWFPNHAHSKSKLDRWLDPAAKWKDIGREHVMDIIKFLVEAGVGPSSIKSPLLRGVLDVSLKLIEAATPSEEWAAFAWNLIDDICCKKIGFEYVEVDCACPNGPDEECLEKKAQVMFKIIGSFAQKHAEDRGPLGVLYRLASDIVAKSAKNKEGSEQVGQSVGKIQKKEAIATVATTAQSVGKIDKKAAIATVATMAQEELSDPGAAVVETVKGWAIGEHCTLKVVKNAASLDGQKAEILACLPKAEPHTAKVKVITGPLTGHLKAFKFEGLGELPQEASATANHPSSASGHTASSSGKQDVGESPDMSSEVFADLFTNISSGCQ